jgi:hypothetical protein
MATAGRRTGTFTGISVFFREVLIHCIPSVPALNLGELILVEKFHFMTLKPKSEGGEGILVDPFVYVRPVNHFLQPL